MSRRLIDYARLVPKYRVEAGKLTVKARSKIHDTTTVWTKVTGSVDADAETLATKGATAVFTIDMTSFDAGDWLKNRKLKSDFEMDKHPTATFELRAVRDVVRDGPTFTATAEGALKWRGKEVLVELKGQGKLDGVSVQDLFDFLGAWFAADQRADFDGSGVLTTQDIPEYLNAWFTGCP